MFIYSLEKIIPYSDTKFLAYNNSLCLSVHTDQLTHCKSLLLFKGELLTCYLHSLLEYHFEMQRKLDRCKQSKLYSMEYPRLIWRL